MDSIIYYVNRSNQRSLRMLSVIDLIRAKTLTYDSAAWLLHRILRGSSWLVGAKPGSAGKTTVASALLAMLPSDTQILLLGDYQNRDYQLPENCNKNYCILTYEISPALYDGYIWKDEVKLMTELGLKGCRLVGNLHADTLEDAREQICSIGGATEEGFGAFNIFIPISLKSKGFSYERRISYVFVFEDRNWKKIDNFTPNNNKNLFEGIKEFLKETDRKDIYLIEDVRDRWLNWIDK